MARFSSGPSGAGRGVAIAAVALLAAVVGVLTYLALQRGGAPLAGATAGPIPTFAYATDAPSPTPTPTPSGPAFDPAAERFLTIGSGAMWRATAGLCGGPEPLLERSADGGATWSDVTPRYLGIHQILGVETFAGSQADMVAATGDGCGVSVQRTFTQGTFWEAHPDFLADWAYVPTGDRSMVMLAGAGVAAPCAMPSSLRAADGVTALVCEGKAFTRQGADWSALPVEGVVALAVSDGNVVAAHRAADCAGLAVTSVSGAGQLAPLGCIADADTSAPAALAVNGASVIVWSGDRLSTLTAP